MAKAGFELGEAADEADWRALVMQGLKGAPWERLVGKTGDGLPIAPLYREPDAPTAADQAGFPGAAPFIRGGARQGEWLIRQAFTHPDPAHANREILADLQGGVSAIELVIDPEGRSGVMIQGAGDLDRALADVILEAAPVSLDAGEHGAWAAGLLRDKLKGVAAPGTAFGLDPIGAAMRTGALCQDEYASALSFTAEHCRDLPAAHFLRADARIVHEAGGTEAQEIAVALASAIHHLRDLDGRGLGIADAARAISFAVSVGPDVLVETAKLRALRLCWARVLEASGAAPEQRAAYIHAFSSRRMLTRYDANTNILRITCAAFAAAIAGADAITTANFTDALGLPTPFARRVARNTQHVLFEECRLGHVADPAGGAWFVEKMTRDLAGNAWEILQEIEAKDGIVEALKAGWIQANVRTAYEKRARAVATRREAITGVTDFPLLGAKAPDFIVREYSAVQSSPAPAATRIEALAPIRWAEPFEAPRDRAEAKAPRPAVFFATLGALAAFGPRAQFTRNLLAAGGVGANGEENAHRSRDAMIDAFRASGARVAVICGTDVAYEDEAENAAQRLKAAGADWVLLAGKPGEREGALRQAGIDQFVFVGQDALEALTTLHTALGIA